MMFEYIKIHFVDLYWIVTHFLSYISSVYSPFSDGVGLSLYNIPSSGVLVKSIGAIVL